LSTYLIIGFKTGGATILLIFAMFVTVVSFHANHSLFCLHDFSYNKKFAMIYGVGFLLFLVKHSINHFIKSAQYE